MGSAAVLDVVAEEWANRVVVDFHPGALKQFASGPHAVDGR